VNYVQSNPQLSNKEVPASYVRLDAELKTVKTPTLSWEQFRDLAIHNGIAPEEVEPVTEFLHVAGSLLHFDDEHGGLRDLVILDPQWLVCITFVQ
jgi:hypothetical protein